MIQIGHYYLGDPSRQYRGSNRKRDRETKGNAIDNRELYEELVCSHARDVYRFAYRLSGSEHRAEDLVQETMYHAWRSIDSLREPDRARAWLLQILHNRHSHWLRTQARRVKTVPDSDQLNRTADQANTDVVAKLSNQELLQRSLDKLEIRYKEPFLLVFMQGMTCREVAEVLDLPLGTVLSRIHRARQRLKGFVQQLDPTAKRTSSSVVLNNAAEMNENGMHPIEKRLSKENE